MKKIFFTCLFAVVGFIVAIIAVVAYFVRTEVGTFDYETVKNYYVTQFRQDLSDAEKEVLKEAISETRYKVYEEATEHNPEGDVLPDEIDDKVKERVKEELQ